MIGMRVHPGRVLVTPPRWYSRLSCCWPIRRCTALDGHHHGLIILYNFSGVWAMARILLPKILGRRGRASCRRGRWAAKK